MIKMFFSNYLKYITLGIITVLVTSNIFYYINYKRYIVKYNSKVNEYENYKNKVNKKILEYKKELNRIKEESLKNKINIRDEYITTMVTTEKMVDEIINKYKDKNSHKPSDIDINSINAIYNIYNKIHK